MHFSKPIFILSLVSLLLLSQSALALQSGDFTYDVSGSTVIIIGYTGAGGAVVIPDTIDSKPVIRIGNEAFKDKTSLISVTIPSSVTIIGEAAFANCTGLTV
jgi:hypothetical protein